ncbi:hypothetical protein [Fibrella forsythiae]|uniref:Big-1 domain-containing protein n=1 Tax=Fibrella forsythiae TaxID=2817061 RepID=A0ABS3JH82_9BACT|nr:hypothetical protein [Fibrella forsythiae]MBO0949372.1 hypothetical protein [Fibrella forsythiae]
MKTPFLISLVAVSVFSCNYDETPIRTADVIKDITFEKAQLDADGMSQTRLTVELPFKADADKRTVTISTSSGTFAATDGKSTINVVAVQDETQNPFRLLAQATLISPQTEGNAIITASIAGYAQTKSYTFITAQPEAIVITPSQLVIKQGPENEIQLVVTLTRTKGIPSLNQSVQLTVSDPAGNQKGRFRSSTSVSDPAGKCYFAYTLGTDKYEGPLIIKATTSNNKSSTYTIYAQ